MTAALARRRRGRAVALGSVAGGRRPLAPSAAGPPGWWRRWPPLPVPDAEAYWRFRIDDRLRRRRRRPADPRRRGGLPPMVSEDAQTGRADSLSAMERVLLLNATYEPLALVSDRRAVVLVLAGRAEAVAFRPDGPVFHSAQLSVEVPAIVRLSPHGAHPAVGPDAAPHPPGGAAARRWPLRVLLGARRHRRPRGSRAGAAATSGPTSWPPASGTT